MKKIKSTNWKRIDFILIDIGLIFFVISIIQKAWICDEYYVVG
jgi:hypothetical protein